MSLPTLLFAVNGAFVVTAIATLAGHTRSGWSASATGVPPWEARLSLWALVGACVVGVLLQAASLVRKHRGESESSRHERWEALHAAVLLFLTCELLWEALLTTGTSTVWALPNGAQRVRVVLPLRYLSWASTNADICCAVAVALGLSRGAMLRSCAAIVVCTLAAFPLELTPVGSPAWSLALFFRAAASPTRSSPWVLASRAAHRAPRRCCALWCWCSSSQTSLSTTSREW